MRTNNQISQDSKARLSFGTQYLLREVRTVHEPDPPRLVCRLVLDVAGFLPRRLLERIKKLSAPEGPEVPFDCIVSGATGGRIVDDVAGRIEVVRDLLIGLPRSQRDQDTVSA